MRLSLRREASKLLSPAIIEIIIPSLGLLTSKEEKVYSKFYWRNLWFILKDKEMPLKIIRLFRKRLEMGRKVYGVPI